MVFNTEDCLNFDFIAFIQQLIPYFPWTPSSDMLK